MRTLLGKGSGKKELKKFKIAEELEKERQMKRAKKIKWKMETKKKRNEKENKIMQEMKIKKIIGLFDWDIVRWGLQKISVW